MRVGDGISVAVAVGGAGVPVKVESGVGVSVRVGISVAVGKPSAALEVGCAVGAVHPVTTNKSVKVASARVRRITCFIFSSFALSRVWCDQVAGKNERRGRSGWNTPP